MIILHWVIKKKYGDIFQSCEKKGAKHKVFKDRFDSKEMVNSALYREKLNYIHNNPCTSKWRLAEKPEDL